jgi:hypothetical protein
MNKALISLAIFCIVLAAHADLIVVPQAAPYSSDANTVLLEHFDGATTGATNGVVSYVNGVFGMGAHLNDNSWISWTLGALTQGTIEFWANLDSLTNAASGGFLSLATAAFGQFYAPTMLVEVPFSENGDSSHKPVGHLHNGATWYTTPAGTNVPNFGAVTANQWHHYAFTWGSNGLFFYLDGALISSNTTALSQNSGTAWWAVGCGLTDIARITNGGFNGAIDELRVSNIQRTFTSGPQVGLIKLVEPSFTNLSLGTNYQLQLSTDLKTWTNTGAAFSPTNSSMVYPQYWQVDNWSQLFFRLMVSP